MNKTLVIIPARGGSKGIPQKNLQTISGTSLVNLAIIAAKRIVPVEDILVSTDSHEIVEDIKKQNLNVPFMRPEILSGDRVGDFDVILHGLTTAEEYFRKRYDYILMLQPTSPLRTLTDIQSCIRTLTSENVDSVWTVSEVDKKYHPLKQLELNDEGYASLVSETGSKIIARQQLSTTYVRNGACYGFTRDCILAQRTIYGKKLRLIVSETQQISIDTIEDLKKAEEALTTRNGNDR